MNKKETFIKKMKDLYEINLPYNKDDSFNRKRNIIYTEIPQYQETYALSSIVNSKEVKKVEQHIGNKYWIFLNWEEQKMLVTLDKNNFEIKSVEPTENDKEELTLRGLAKMLAKSFLNDKEKMEKQVSSVWEI